jgi:V8-like Glu-specific endopeptidase
MKNWFRACLLLVIVGVTQFYSLEVQAASKGPEIGTQGQSAEARAKAIKALYARLSASPRAAVRHTITLSDDDVDILANPRIDSTGRYRVGVHRSVGRTVSNQDADLIVSIPGAQAIRLELTQVKGTVAVFNNLGEANEYTQDGFTHTFSGNEVRIRGSARVSGAGAVNLGRNLCTENASCVENAECATMPQNIADARDAYASILFASRGSYYVCTGGLLADSDPGTQIPYFLTAHHCIDTATEANSVETRFQYVREECGSAVSCSPLNTSNWGDTVGSTIRATNSAGDFTLLELSGTPPVGSTYLGWNSDPVANTSGALLYRISHPGGYPQAYSEHAVDTAAGTCRTLPRGQFIYSSDTFGATEGGSSGSPVINVNAQVVGQLYGACGTNVNDQCDAINNATVDGAFANYYAEVQPFLGDGSPECSEDSDCNDGDACTTNTCVSGTCSNTLKDCDDGDACTTDSCDSSTGSCTNDLIACDDDNLCTTDSCDPTTGCSNTPIDCDDGDACTTDSCDSSTGSCTNDLIACDDGISCTIDSCDSTTGQCTNDGSDCPAGSVCGNGVCEVGEDCGDCPNDCRAKTNGNPKGQYCCNGNLLECGDSRCSESGWFCGNSNSSACSIDSDCNDGLFCNGTETCSGGVCQPGGDPCPGQGCDEDSDLCVTLTCGGNKAACTSNADCCSGNCRGGTCKGN